MSVLEGWHANNNVHIHVQFLSIVRIDPGAMSSTMELGLSVSDYFKCLLQKIVVRIGP